MIGRNGELLKIKMLETTQGRDIHGTLDHEGIESSILTKDDVFMVDRLLGLWLVENGKAIEITAKHYGAQPEPQARHDETIYPEPEPSTETIMSTKTISPEPKETNHEKVHIANNNSSGRKRHSNQ